MLSTFLASARVPAALGLALLALPSFGQDVANR